MTDDDREARTLRRRGAGAEAEADRLDDDRGPLPGPILVETITVGTYPTAAGRYYAVRVVDPGGAEGEGNTPTFTTVTGTFYAANVGAGIPASGTRVLAFPIGGRNVFAYG